ncbi:UNVERIFIED_ORG: hypothetical protein ABIC58_000249 [Leuconostoc holzapfelii]
MFRLQEGTHAGKTNSGKRFEYSLLSIGGIGEQNEYQLDLKVYGETQSFSTIIQPGQLAEFAGIKFIF